MTTREAIQAIAEQLTDEWVVCTTGYTCRDMQAVRDRPENFYMIGSMGVAAAMGAGLALTRTDRKVAVFDGDGSVLMGLGILPMVGAWRPNNLIHVVFDNEVFASTGGQATFSREVRLDQLARASGYPVVRSVEEMSALAPAWREVLSRPGPVFLLVKCQPDSGSPMPRVGPAPEAITERFQHAIEARTKS